MQKRYSTQPPLPLPFRTELILVGIVLLLWAGWVGWLLRDKARVPGKGQERLVPGLPQTSPVESGCCPLCSRPRDLPGPTREVLTEFTDLTLQSLLILPDCPEKDQKIAARREELRQQR